MKRASLSGLLLFCSLPAAVFLQSTLLANSLPGGVTPDLGFFLTVAAGYRWGAAGGAVTGMWSGALLGAAVGSMAAPLSCLYGFVGWLAGLHTEREPRRWTLPLVAACLAVLTISGSSMLSAWLEGRQPSLEWKLAASAWGSVGALFFLFQSFQKRG